MRPSTVHMASPDPFPAEALAHVAALVRRLRAGWNRLEKQPDLFDALTPPGDRVLAPAGKLSTARHAAAFANASDAAPQSIVQADCRVYQPTMPARSVVCVVTSPPYNLGKPYRSYDDNRPLAEYLAQQEFVAPEIARVLRPDGHRNPARQRGACARISRA